MSNPTALIIDDEPDANALLGMLVAHRGYQIASALDGNVALERLEDSQPDVIFLDLMLPDIDGFEICRKIKSDPAKTMIPVIVVSAARTFDIEKRCYLVGANEFVPKPYTPIQIFRVLDAAEAWRRDLQNRPTEGTIAFNCRDELEPLREFSRLRSILRAWTPLSEDTVASLGDLLRDYLGSAMAWGRSRDGSLVAVLRFQLGLDTLQLSIEDQHDWLGPTPTLIESSFPSKHKVNLTQTASPGRIGIQIRLQDDNN